MCSSHPISRALGAGGPLGSAFKRNKYFKEHFQFVDPIEYILDAEQKKSFQYVPVLKTLQEVLKNKDIAVEAFSRCSSSTGHFESIFDGTCFKDNDFYAVEETRLSIIIYVDEFEVCNPLGTSRKKTENNCSLLGFGQFAIEITVCLNINTTSFTLQIC